MKDLSRARSNSKRAKAKAAVKKARSRLTTEESGIADRLREWRLAEAKKRSTPAFRI